MAIDTDRTERIAFLVRSIVEIARPLSVVLFGSAARADHSESSDVDLMVVMPDGTHRRNMAQQLYRELRGAGWTYRAIAAELTRRGVLTKKGKARWTHQSVASILKRQAA